MDVFTRNQYKNILVENLAYCRENNGLELFAWCIMTNHVHLIVRAKEGYTLSSILRDFKKYTSKKVIQAIKENPQESRKEWLLDQFRTSEGFTPPLARICNPCFVLSKTKNKHAVSN
ncbi:transposase [Sunxiuqinia sp. A32]|uniref:transposase n=1 Tax=Sunxiuqinia sp. A32 TaxID=3461496 RepID=UPI0040455752